MTYHHPWRGGCRVWNVACVWSTALFGSIFSYDFPSAWVAWCVIGWWLNHVLGRMAAQYVISWRWSNWNCKAMRVTGVPFHCLVSTLFRYWHVPETTSFWSVLQHLMHRLKAVYCMVPKHGDLQKIIKDGSKLQKWMPWGDPLEYQEKKKLEV